MTVQITLEMLEEKDACEDQLNVFTEHFPNGFEYENEEDAIEKCFEFAGIFDFERVADELLNADTLSVFLRAVTDACDEHEESKEFAWDECDEVWGKEYRRKEQVALIEYWEAVAIAFAKAYWEQESSK